LINNLRNINEHPGVDIVSLNKKILDNTKKVLLSHKLYLLIKIIIAIVFIYAGLVKLIDPKAFAKAISQYDIMPEFLLAPLAIGLPALEFLAGIGLIFNIRGSLTVIFNLLIIFIFVLGYGIFNDFNIDCGCFSPAEINAHNNLKQALFRDLLMVMAVCYIYIYNRIRYTTNSNHLYGQRQNSI
jgi:uncharacterized membrane protein YphA (DoxX/SURF4 family)